MKIVRINLLVLSLLLFNITVNGQQVMQFSSNDIVGESAELQVGIHSGIFDCNQTIFFPYNVGVVIQYNYIPDITKKLFLGAEVGTFFTASDIDDNNRKTQAAFTDITIYPGLSFPLNLDLKSNDSAKSRFNKLASTRRFRIGLGFTVAIPIRKRATGSNVNNDAVKTGVGFSLRTSYEMKDRLSIFFNVTRIGRDMDAYSYVDNTTVRTPGNEHNVTYIYKLGMLWNFLNM